MNISQSKKTAILRIINNELRQKNLCAQAYSEAKSKSKGDRNSTMKHYYRIRFAELLPMDAIVPNNAHNNVKERYASTSECATYISSRITDKDEKNSKELIRKHETLEIVIANIVLVLGASSTVSALWLYSGSTISSLFCLVLLVVVLGMLLLPKFLEKLKVSSYLSSLSLLCIVVAISSFGSGMKLMRDDPSNEATLAEKVADKDTELHSRNIEFGMSKNVDSISFQDAPQNSISMSAY